VKMALTQRWQHLPPIEKRHMTKASAVRQTVGSCSRFFTCDHGYILDFLF